MTTSTGKHLDQQARIMVGEVVTIARANAVPWKTLEDQFGICRRQLYRYALDVASGGPRAPLSDVNAQMSQQSSEMSQQGCCPGIDA